MELKPQRPDTHLAYQKEFRAEVRGMHVGWVIAADGGGWFAMLPKGECILPSDGRPVFDTSDQAAEGLAQRLLDNLYSHFKFT